MGCKRRGGEAQPQVEQLPHPSHSQYRRCTLIYVPAHVQARWTWAGGPIDGPIGGRHFCPQSTATCRDEPATSTSRLCLSQLSGVTPAGAAAGPQPPPATVADPSARASASRPPAPERPPAPLAGVNPAWLHMWLLCPPPPDGPWRWRVVGWWLDGQRTAADAAMAVNADTCPSVGMGVAAVEEVGVAAPASGFQRIGGRHLRGGHGASQALEICKGRRPRQCARCRGHSASGGKRASAPSPSCAGARGGGEPVAVSDGPCCISHVGGGGDGGGRGRRQ